MKAKTTALFVLTAGALTVMNGLAQPVITVQPANATVEVGGTYNNRVVATSPDPLLFEWYFNGVLLGNQTTSNLTILNIQTTNAGNYWVLVTDFDGAATSRVATLTVAPGPMFIKITEGPLVTDAEPNEHSTWWDYDNDGFLDVFVTVTAPFGPGLLQSFYHNNGDGTFTKITTNALTQTRKRGICAGVGDYDNDGDQDIYVPSNAWNPGEPKDDLFRNDGNGVFTALAAEPWTQDLDGSYDCTLVDFDLDGWLDIFVVNWGKAPCLYRQTSPDTFKKLATAETGSLLQNLASSFNAAWADYDNDGDPDVWIEGYQGGSRLLQNDGLGFFTVATPPSFAQSPGGQGMWGDFDNDGFLDLFVGGYTATPHVNALYHNLGGQGFTNVADGDGVDLTMDAWAATLGDYDNDGWLDIFAADSQGSQPNALFHNRGDGTFEKVDAGGLIHDGDQRWGVRWVDYDNDGWLDLFMTCGTSDGTTEYPKLNHLYRNNGRAIGNTNHWLKIKLEGRASNRSGIGAKIRVKATIAGQELWQMREITGNGYSQTCPGLVAHFGLGDASSVETLRVEWPSGYVTTIHDVVPNQMVTIQELPDVKCGGWDGSAMCLAITGNIGERYELRTSTDVALPLADWEPWLTITNINKTMLVTNTSPLATQRFHMAVPTQ